MADLRLVLQLIVWMRIRSFGEVCEQPLSGRKGASQHLASSLTLKFADAPHVHPYNQPKYQAQICHAVHFARARRRKGLWCVAQDWPLTAEEMDLDPDWLVT